MILLSRRSLLGIAAVVDIALHGRASPVPAKALSERHHLPPRHLETMLQALVRTGILRGVRGPRGGYELAVERRKLKAGEEGCASHTIDSSSTGNRITTVCCGTHTHAPENTTP